VGFLIGVSVTMIMLLFITGVVSGGNVANFGIGSASSSTQAVTAFASLLFISVTFFTIFVTLYRDVLLPPPAMASTDHAGDALPPPAFASSSTASYPTTSYADNSYGKDNYGLDSHESVTVSGSQGGVL
jgi:hypothetical protein